MLRAERPLLDRETTGKKRGTFGIAGVVEDGAEEEEGRDELGAVFAEELRQDPDRCARMEDSRVPALECGERLAEASMRCRRLRMFVTEGRALSLEYTAGRISQVSD